MTYLSIAGMLVLTTFFPVLVRMIITAGQLILRRIRASLAGGVQGRVVLDAAY